MTRIAALLLAPLLLAALAACAARDDRAGAPVPTSGVYVGTGAGVGL